MHGMPADTAAAGALRVQGIWVDRRVWVDRYGWMGMGGWMDMDIVYSLPPAHPAPCPLHACVVGAGGVAGPWWPVQPSSHTPGLCTCGRTRGGTAGGGGGGGAQAEHAACGEEGVCGL